MDIDRAREKRAELESRINALLRAFEQQTKLRIRDIELVEGAYMTDPQVAVKVDLG